jgi:hypothetical protein
MVGTASFQTRFFVPLDDMAEMDEVGRRKRLKEATEAHRGDLVCWRCGRDFGRRFKLLKEHLEGEVEAWKKGDGPEWRGHGKTEESETEKGKDKTEILPVPEEPRQEEKPETVGSGSETE